MKKTAKVTKKLNHKELIYCLDIFCRASFAIAQTDSKLSKEMLSAIEILTLACTMESSRLKENEERIDKFSEKYEKIEEGTISDLFTGEILYKG